MTEMFGRWHSSSFFIYEIAVPRIGTTHGGKGSMSAKHRNTVFSHTNAIAWSCKMREMVFFDTQRGPNTMRGFRTPNPGVSGGVRGFPGGSGATSTSPDVVLIVKTYGVKIGIGGFLRPCWPLLKLKKGKSACPRDWRAALERPASLLLEF